MLHGKANAGQPLPEPAELDRLVEELGAPTQPKREAAYEQLARLGQGGVPRLRLATFHARHEIRWRAEQLLGELVPREAWNEETRKRLREANVSFALKDAPLEQALRDLAAQAQVPLELSPALKELLQAKPLAVSLEVKEYGAALALQRLLSTHKLTYSLVFNGIVVEAGEYGREELRKKALDAKVGPFAFQDRPLREALQEVRGALPMGLAFDPEVFKKEAERGYAVNVSFKKALRLESVLAMLLEGHDLGFVFDGRVLNITNRARAANELQTETFELKGLVDLLMRRKGDVRLTEIEGALRESVDVLAWDAQARMAWRADQELLISQRRETLTRIAAYLELLRRLEGALSQPVGEALEF
ncbi:MAG: hypothetical protein M5U26_14810 [Planctomycetota bacterium]|nr:hypothetical protein [Planctomycetota bacterium]